MARFVACLATTLRPFALLLAALQFVPAAKADESSSRRLADLSLEELANIQITSVSKRSERISDAAASVFVITGDDIRRSGARSLPEVLRLAPNLQVAQVSGPGFAITARGFNNTAANKLLVLIDGRSVYTPLFSGVFWDVQDTMLEDVERIEVISGPGGTLWGVNAVNGVINIITRSASDTRGALVAASAGDPGSEVAARFGSSAGSEGSFRAYAKYFDRDRTSTASGEPKDDGWYKSQAGFRADWDLGSDRFTLLGNAYTGAEGQPKPGAISVTGINLALGTISLSGANITSHWARRLASGSEVSVQVYFDRTQRTVPPTFAETLDIADVQLQHSIASIGGHHITWGGEYRYAWDDVTNSATVAFLPATLQQSWASLFVQDEIRLADSLQLTAGARLERNDYTGSEFLPSVRLAWKPAPSHLLWTALSRTVRAPSRLDRDTFVPGNPPFLLRGGPDVVSEMADVFEVGYRGQPTRSISLSATVYRARYDHLRTQEVAPSRTFLVFASEMEGRSTGLEAWGTYQGSDSWRLSAGFSGLREKLALKPGSSDAAGLAAQEGRDPAQRWMLRLSIDLPYRSELDVIARRVSALANPLVPAYSSADVRLGWRPARAWEVYVAAQNLGRSHGEFTDIATRTELERGVFAGITWRP